MTRLWKEHPGISGAFLGFIVAVALAVTLYMMRDGFTSAPTTRTFSYAPVATNWLAVVSEYVNAEHAALKSNPHACGAPIFA